jgi:ubiquinone/menaquinone biosynthesis C-methylase UbiE
LLAFFYDPLVRVLALGKADRLRQATLDAAGIGPDDAVLDVGCATGPLTRLARQATRGRVTGLDASPQMLDRARAASPFIEYVHGRAEKLPFDDHDFDAVILSLVLHYLSAEDAARAIAEAHRVLGPGGRVVVVDFGRSTGRTSRIRAHLMLHGGAAATAPDHAGLLRDGGFAEVGVLICPVPALTITRGVRAHASKENNHERAHHGR